MWRPIGSAVAEGDSSELMNQCADPLSEVRHQLSILARRRTKRVFTTTPGQPCKWKPYTVFNPEAGQMFTDASAWELVAHLLESGHEMSEVELRKPPGKKAYVMKVRLADAEDEIYIKLQLGSGKVIGRSFHYSEPIPLGLFGG